MTWYAIAAVDDAVDATRGFLFPFSLVRWTKLAILVLFMGGGIGFDVSTPFPPTDAPAEELPTDVAAPEAVSASVSTEQLIAAGIAVALVGLAFLVVSVTLRFVFYDALRTNEVRLWAPFKRRFGQAVRLLGFQLGLLLLVVGPIAAGVAYAIDRGIGVDAVGVAGGLAIGSLVGALLLLLALVSRFTGEFVLPVMVLTDAGPVAAWRRFWPTLRDGWLQFFAYLIVHFVLAVGIGVAQGVVAFLLAGIVLALGAIAGLVVVGLLGGVEAALASTVGIATLAAIALVAVLALLVVLLPVRILATTYLTTYELSVLGGVDEAFMLLPASIVPEPDVLADRDGDAWSRRGGDRERGGHDTGTRDTDGSEPDTGRDRDDADDEVR